MKAVKKIIVTSKTNLKAKYESDFGSVEKLLKKLVAADKKKNLDTSIVYIDDQVSAKKAGISPVTSVTRPSSKKAVDDLYKKHTPAYLVIFGSGDVIPFQELDNKGLYDPRNDDDRYVPSDLPYACESAYDTKMKSFTGPTRVVGRIPDIMGKNDLNYVKIVINTIIKIKPSSTENFLNYFALTADAWKKSTSQTLSTIFGNSSALRYSPPASRYTLANLKPLTHFYNCHGAPEDSGFYGQLTGRKSTPLAITSSDLKDKISFGTIVAAECCYGAELYNPDNEGSGEPGIANTYFKHEAVAFVGSTTIAYGPEAGQDLADLITQYFIKNVLSGASTGRALLDARQKFLSVSSPLDPYELKTLAQFYLLGDPSIQVVINNEEKSGVDTIDNRRMRLAKKGLDLFSEVETSTLVRTKYKKTSTDKMKSLFKEAGLKGKQKESVFKVEHKNNQSSRIAKTISGSSEIVFRTFVEDEEQPQNINTFKVLIVKESGNKILGWKVYYRK